MVCTMKRVDRCCGIPCGVWGTASRVECGAQHPLRSVGESAARNGGNVGRGLSKNTDARINELLERAERECRAAVAPDRATRDALERRVSRGLIASPFPGLYLRSETWETLQEDAGLRTTMLARGITSLRPNWTFCHATAAHLHGLRVSYPLLEKLYISNVFGAHGRLTTPAPGRLATPAPGRPIPPAPAESAPSQPVITSRYVRNLERVFVGGAWVTSLRITALDVLRTQEPREGLIVADAAAMALGLSASGLVSELRAVGKGLPGIGRALRVAAYADRRAESGAESSARAMMIRLRYVLPQLQVWVNNPLDACRPFRVDGVWIMPDGRVVMLEVDGMEKRKSQAMTRGRSQEQVRWEERQRESLLTASGAGVVRLTYWETLSEHEVSRRLDAFGIPKLGSVAAAAMMMPDSAMNGGAPAPNGAVIRDAWLRYER